MQSYLRLLILWRFFIDQVDTCRDFSRFVFLDRRFFWNGIPEINAEKGEGIHFQLDIVSTLSHIKHYELTNLIVSIFR